MVARAQYGENMYTQHNLKKHQEVHMGGFASCITLWHYDTYKFPSGYLCPSLYSVLGMSVTPRLQL